MARNRLIRHGLAALLLALAQASSATLLDGHQIEWSYHFDDFGDVITSQTAVVAPGAEFNYGGVYDVDVSDTSILIRFFDCNCVWTDSNFNGPSFFDVFATIDPFTSVNLTTNLPGLSQSAVSFDADRISLNWQGLPNDGSALNDTLFARLDINQHNVPEPTALALMGLGLLAMRKRKLAI